MLQINAILVTVRILSISNIAGFRPRTVSGLTVSSSPGARRHLFPLSFPNRVASRPALRERTSSSRHRRPRISL
jgi:hypothetical protein